VKQFDIDRAVIQLGSEERPDIEHLSSPHVDER
jgi:hypothetical protein